MGGLEDVLEIIRSCETGSGEEDESESSMTITDESLDEAVGEGLWS